jgi:hypothetical protein
MDHLELVKHPLFWQQLENSLGKLKSVILSFKMTPKILIMLFSQNSAFHFLVGLLVLFSYLNFFK